MTKTISPWSNEEVEKPKECKGCKKWSAFLIMCFHSKNDQPFISRCPCQKCLVRVICEILCDEFYDHKKQHWEEK